MSEIRIPLEYHGPTGSSDGIRVELVEDGVHLTIDGEEGSDEPTHRTLMQAEARALASTLLHYAAEWGAR